MADFMDKLAAKRIDLAKGDIQGSRIKMDPRTANELITELSRQIERNPEIASQPVLLTSPTVRRHIYKLTSRFLPQLAIISHNELTSDAHVSSVATVEIAYAS